MRTAVWVVLVAVLGVFAWLNRHALMFPHTLDLGFTVYKGVPLGLILLLTGVAISTLFYFWSGLRGLRAEADSARLLRDMEALRHSLDTQESSRFAQLQSHLDQRLSALPSSAPDLGGVNARIDDLAREMQLQFAQIDDYLKRKLG